MHKSKKSSPSAILMAVLLLINLPTFVLSLFEYICVEKQLYRPYVHVYKERKSTRILDLGPGFHDLSEYMNVYVCINGVAYLYFSKTTELGEVYEEPQLKKYAHTCEMYNVQPRDGSASVMEVQLHLRAILLMGDPIDYRRPSIQKFTAPYYFRKDQLSLHLPNSTEYILTPALYLNASSMVIIGQSECTLSKGSSKNTLIKVRPHIFTPPPNGTGNFLCKIGFQPLLDKASTPPGGPIPAEENRLPALALINDEAIRVERCVTSPSFDAGSASEHFNTITEAVDQIRKDYEDKKSEHIDKFNTLVDAVLTPLRSDMEKLELKKSENSTKKGDLKKLDKQILKLDLRIRREEEKKTAYADAMQSISKQLTEIDSMKDDAKPDGSKATSAKSDKEKAEKAKEEWEKVEDQKPPAQQTDIDAKKEAYDEARKQAKISAREYQWAASDLEVRYLRLKKQKEKVDRLSVYKPSSTSAKGKRTSTDVNPEGTASVVIGAREEDCEMLPVLEGPDGECAKGKPDKNDSCSLFQTTLGLNDVWSDKIEPPRNDSWKKEVLQLIGDIFTTACDKIRNVKKFVKLNNRVMQYYLTNEKLFNLKPNLTTDTCLNFKFSKTLRMLEGSGSSPFSNLTFMEEKKFWSTIKYVLHECKKQSRRLRFKEADKTAGTFKFVKNFGSEQEEMVEVLLHQEQADIEYSYNWAIDMNWRMFVTVLGLCMPSYEKTVPLITSRFFSLFTEYFLIPLRETWINPKDNIIFQFIMGEFYNPHTEFWGDMCMEASFIFAGQRDYRPPRSLMVNCASEHNYFLNGEFSKGIHMGIGQ